MVGWYVLSLVRPPIERSHHRFLFDRNPPPPPIFISIVNPHRFFTSPRELCPERQRSKEPCLIPRQQGRHKAPARAVSLISPSEPISRVRRRQPRPSRRRNETEKDVGVVATVAALPSGGRRRHRLSAAANQWRQGYSPTRWRRRATSHCRRELGASDATGCELQRRRRWLELGGDPEVNCICASSTATRRPHFRRSSPPMATSLPRRLLPISDAHGAAVSLISYPFKRPRLQGVALRRRAAATPTVTPSHRRPAPAPPALHIQISSSSRTVRGRTKHLQSHSRRAGGLPSLHCFIQGRPYKPADELLAAATC